MSGNLQEPIATNIHDITKALLDRFVGYCNTFDTGLDYARSRNAFYAAVESLPDGEARDVLLRQAESAKTEHTARLYKVLAGNFLSKKAHFMSNPLCNQWCAEQGRRAQRKPATTKDKVVTEEMRSAFLGIGRKTAKAKPSLDTTRPVSAATVCRFMPDFTV